MEAGSSGSTSADADYATLIREWRSIITLILFVAANLVVLCPFSIPLPVPRFVRSALLSVLSHLRIVAPRGENESRKTLFVVGIPFLIYLFPMNLVTAPLAVDLFLLAISAIGRTEVAAGTIGTDNIVPIDIMVFFISLAYIAVSLDATGLIRYLAYKVLVWGGKAGRRLFFYLYLFWFSLTAFIGNDPIILSGTPFLAYMTRVAKNIESPRAWIFTQFTMANVASAILVSSNPTNLVLTGAFEVRFIDYTANIIVPVIVTAILMFPFLLYVVFRGESLIPSSIDMHELPEEARQRKPVNPNIPSIEVGDDDESKLVSLEEIMNPYLDKWSAIFVASIMAVALITVLALNAATAGTGGQSYPVFWVTLPAAFLAFCFDVSMGWAKRHETREIAQKRRQESEAAKHQGAVNPNDPCSGDLKRLEAGEESDSGNSTNGADGRPPSSDGSHGAPANTETIQPVKDLERAAGATDANRATGADHCKEISPQPQQPTHTTLSSLARNAWSWARDTFPNASHVLSLLPYPLVPFAFSMFVLVQALVTKGWIPLFAHGWDAWVNKTGTVGAIGGMGFLSVILSNFAGTNIGTTILLSRVIQAWQTIHKTNGIPISNRTFWATVYSMALGVNYGAFSLAFSGALAGLLWRDILAKKHIHIGSIEFWRVNLPIIIFAMVVGCSILLGEVYIMRSTDPYDA